MLNTIKPLIHLFKSQTPRLYPIYRHKQHHQDVETGVDYIRLPPDGIQRERERHRHKQATQFCREGVQSHSGGAYLIGQDFGWVEDCEWGDTEAVGTIVDEDHSDSAVDAGCVGAGAVKSGEAAYQVEGYDLTDEGEDTEGFAANAIGEIGGDHCDYEGPVQGLVEFGGRRTRRLDSRIFRTLTKRSK